MQEKEAKRKSRGQGPRPILPVTWQVPGKDGLAPRRRLYFCVEKTKDQASMKASMEVAVERKRPTVFRLSAELRRRLIEQAAHEHRSVNDLVEGILLDALYREPNQETIAAMEDVKADRDLKPVDMSSLEAFLKSCTE